MTTKRKRILAGTGLAVTGALIARALAPSVRAHIGATCGRMVEQMPDTFPPKRILRGVEEARDNTARIIALLEQRDETPAQPSEPRPEVDRRNETPVLAGRGSA